MVRQTLCALALFLAATTGAVADIVIEDAFARSAGPTAKSGAAFMTLTNTGDADDRLMGVESPAAMRIELHTHEQTSDGVMKMIHMPEGFVIASGDTLSLERGGDHVMLMGLTAPFEDGGVVPLTLNFEQAGEIFVEVPVDLNR